MTNSLRELYRDPELDNNSIKVMRVNSLSLLLRVEGAVSTINPYLLAAHLDVVPPGDSARWDNPPFLGELVEEAGEQFVYGRGAIDDKHSLMGILQSLETILVSGDRPRRTLYIGLGHDEEISESRGMIVVLVVMVVLVILVMAFMMDGGGGDLATTYWTFLFQVVTREPRTSPGSSGPSWRSTGSSWSSFSTRG